MIKNVLMIIKTKKQIENLNTTSKKLRQEIYMHNQNATYPIYNEFESHQQKFAAKRLMDTMKKLKEVNIELKNQLEIWEKLSKTYSYYFLKNISDNFLLINISFFILLCLVLFINIF